EVKEDMYNYGQLQVTFDDGSVGWYEAGWGPMMSETAFFVKDVIGPKGSVSIVDETGERKEDSQDIEGHSKTGGIKLHHAALNENKEFAKKDEFFSTRDEPNHDELCHLEQEYLLNAIENNVDLQDHLNDAVNSLRIVLAADKSFKTGKTVEL
ncbi:MAG: gfo/Idh/MocA family oxidoreductase, partial [Saprospiraceae bacterium]|nr:gfo/Idh/MocA family oxidoreductase [Saprospiraceae bacterium]